MDGLWIIEVKSEATKGVFEIIEETTEHRWAMHQFAKYVGGDDEEEFEEFRLTFIPDPPKSGKTRAEAWDAAQLSAG
jgi:hypothetical protein